jgi:hypothetical protein
MEWLSENWFFVLILAVFVGMHMFGHGGCGGWHGGMARMTTRAGRGRPAGTGTRGQSC